jgi:hypothetical protein
MRGEIATVGELYALGARVGARLNDIDAQINIRVIKHRDHALIHHGRSVLPCDLLLPCLSSYLFRGGPADKWSSAS